MGVLVNDPSLRARRIALREKLVLERKEHRRKNFRYSDNEKIEIVKTWLLLGGNTTLTAITMKTTEESIRLWRKQAWWQEVENALRKEERLELSAKTKKIIDKSMDMLADRLENGDFIFDQKTGEIKRKPVNAKDLLKITTEFIDQKQMLDKATQDNAAPESNEDKLIKLAEQFAQLAKKATEKTKPTIEVTDVVFVENKKEA